MAVSGEDERAGAAKPNGQQRPPATLLKFTFNVIFQKLKQNFQFSGDVLDRAAGFSFFRVRDMWPYPLLSKLLGTKGHRRT